MNSCIFCKIVDNQIPADVLFDDDEIIAFRDIHPKAPVHLLIIPKKHIESVATITNEDSKLVGQIVLAAKEIAKRLDLSGYRLIFNTGEDAGAEVPHIHLHLLGGKKLGDI